MAEERDVPPLEDLLVEVDALMARLDKDFPAGTTVSPESVMSELRNTILPLMKDVVAATMIDFIEMRDIVDPIKLDSASAEEIDALLKAFAASRPGDTALQERIAQALEPLDQDDDQDEDTETDQN